MRNCLSRAAFVGFGEINTDRAVIERKCAEAVAHLHELTSEIVVAGPVDDAPGYAQADEAVRALKGAEFDVLVVCIAGWIPTHAVLRVIDHFRHKPMLLWGLCGWREGDRIISTADQAGSTALRYAMQEMGYKFHYVYSVIDKPWPRAQIEPFLSACHALARLRDARVGTMGYRDMLLFGTMYDGVSLRAKLGVEVEPFEMLEMEAAAAAIDDARLLEGIAFAKANFTFTSECPDAALRDSVRWALALVDKIAERGYEAISLIDVDGMKKLKGLPPAFIFNLVDMMTRVCTIPENDIMGSVTQLMVHYATGQIAAYAEFYEFFENSFLMGVPDFIPREVTQGDALIKPSTFGLLSTSLLNVSKFKDGPVTLCRLVTVGGRYVMHLLTGDAKQPPRWEESGWAPPAPQLPSLEVTPHCSMASFASKVSSQHIIVSYGDHTAALRHLCALLDIEVI